jgi:hypothetical protein
MSEHAPAQIAMPKLEPMARLSVKIGALVNVGPVPLGERRVIPILGGTVTGEGVYAPLLNGSIDAGGADFQILRGDGILELQARYIIRTDAGAMIFVENNGLRHGPPELIAMLARGEPVDPALIYFRAVPRFETGALDLAFLTRDIFVCSGARFADRVELRVFRLS